MPDNDCHHDCYTYSVVTNSNTIVTQYETLPNIKICIEFPLYYMNYIILLLLSGCICTLSVTFLSVM